MRIFTFVLLLGHVTGYLVVHNGNKYHTVPADHSLNEDEFEKADDGACPLWKPFACLNGECISLQYICDGNVDCSNGYDENEMLCTARNRPPTDTTTDFLDMLLDNFGNNFFIKFFGTRAGHRLANMGGVQKVAIALSESPTVADLAEILTLDKEEVRQFVKAMIAVVEENAVELKRLEISARQARPLKLYFERLIDTGFLKNLP